MNAPFWHPFSLTTNRVRARPDALWTRVADHVAGPVKLRITAGGTWHVSAGEACGPEGCRRMPAAGGLMTRALRGALIGKIGGSASETPDPQAFTFVAGSFTTIVLDAKVEGPLFLTMNDEPSCFDHHKGVIQVVIEFARSA